MSMIMSDNLGDVLDEYVMITKTIENIQDKINRYKKTIELRIDNATSDREQRMYVTEFKQFITDIKNDPHITKKYRRLKQRQKDLRDRLLFDNKSTNDISTDIVTNDNVNCNNSNSINTNVAITDNINYADEIISNLQSKYSNSLHIHNNLMISVDQSKEFDLTRQNEREQYDYQINQQNEQNQNKFNILINDVQKNLS